MASPVGPGAVPGSSTGAPSCPGVQGQAVVDLGPHGGHVSYSMGSPHGPVGTAEAAHNDMPAAQQFQHEVQHAIHQQTTPRAAMYSTGGDARAAADYLTLPPAPYTTPGGTEHHPSMFDWSHNVPASAAEQTTMNYGQPMLTPAPAFATYGSSVHLSLIHI